MLRQFRNKQHLILFLLIIGLTGLIVWQINRATYTANLLTNPDFEQAEMEWQIIALGGAQAASKASAGDPGNTILELNIPDTADGSGVGIGQAIQITPLRRYKLTATYRLTQVGQNPAEILLRVLQFDRAGELIKQDEILNPASLDDSKNQGGWRVLTHSFITDEQAASVEVGIGFFGNQPTVVEIDHVSFQLHPTWFSTVRNEPTVLSMLLLLVLASGYTLAQALRPVRYRLLVNGSLVIASLVITLMAVEVVIRFIPIRLIGNNWPRGYHITSDGGQSYRLAKNYPPVVITNEQGDQTLIMSNSLGVRDIEIPPLAKQEAIVLVLGDSMTFGVVGEIDDTWPRRLDGQVAEILKADKYHFVNGGVSGYNTFQEVDFFRTLVKEMELQGVKPKIALLSFFSEIWGRNLYGPDGRFTVANDVVMYSSLRQTLFNLPTRLIEQSRFDDLKLMGTNRIQSLHETLLSKSRTYFTLSLLVTLRLDDDWDARPEGVDAAAINFEALKSFKEVADANGIQPVVAYLPAHDMFSSPNGNQELIDQLSMVCQSLSLTLLNPYDNMQGLGVSGDNAKEKLTLGYDSHFSVKGNSLYAKALAPLVVDYLRQYENGSLSLIGETSNR